MKCNEAKPLLELVLDDEAAQSRESDLFKHLSGCADCAADWNALQGMKQNLQEYQSMVRVPHDLGERIRVMLLGTTPPLTPLGNSGHPAKPGNDLFVDEAGVDGAVPLTQVPGDFPDDENLPLTASGISGELLRADITKILSKLSEQERVVITLRFGLNSGQVCTLQEVGEILGLSRESVRQIEQKALRMLRPSRRRSRRNRL